MEKLLKRKTIRPGKEMFYVLPTFVTDSVARGKMVPHADYIMEGLRNLYGGSIKKSFAAEPSVDLEDIDEEEEEEEDMARMRGSPLGRRRNASGSTATTSTIGGSHKDIPVGVITGSCGQKRDFPGDVIVTSGKEGVDSTEAPSSSSAPPPPPPHYHHPPCDDNRGTPDPTPPSLPSQPSKRKLSGPSHVSSADAPNAPPWLYLYERGGGSGSSSAAIDGNNGSNGKRLRSTKEDADFIPNFFNSSRLHFIGSFRSHLQDLVAEKTRNRRPINLPLPSIGMERVVIHIDMDCFFVSVLLRNKPELMDRPVAVAHTGNIRGAASSEISSCNYAARAKGVRASMWMGRAKELCPELVVLPYDFEAYEVVSDTIYDIFLVRIDERELMLDVVTVS